MCWSQMIGHNTRLEHPIPTIQRMALCDFSPDANHRKVNQQTITCCPARRSGMMARWNRQRVQNCKLIAQLVKRFSTARLLASWPTGVCAMRDRILLWTFVMGCVGFLAAGRGSYLPLGLTISGAVLGAGVGLLLAIVFSNREKRRRGPKSPLTR
jgi:hypothetical protein